MKKLNSIVYNKLILQAEEAKEQGMEKLAHAILGSLTPYPENENISYDNNELNDDIYHGLWKLATCVIKYHNVASIDSEKVDETIMAISSKLITELESTLGVEKGAVGPLETKLFGQK